MLRTNNPFLQWPHLPSPFLWKKGERNGCLYTSSACPWFSSSQCGDSWSFTKGASSGLLVTDHGGWFGGQRKRIRQIYLCKFFELTLVPTCRQLSCWSQNASLPFLYNFIQAKILLLAIFPTSGKILQWRILGSATGNGSFEHKTTGRWSATDEEVLKIGIQFGWYVTKTGWPVDILRVR